MSPQAVRQLAKDIAAAPTPEHRIVAFQQAGGRMPHNSRDLSLLREGVGTYAAADTQVRLEAKLAEREAAQARYKDASKTAGVVGSSEFSRSVAQDRQGVRDLIEMQMGQGKSVPVTLQQKQADVMARRHQLADRIDYGIAQRSDATIQDSLRDAYDSHVLEAASADLGLPTFIEEAKALDERSAHLKPDADVTDGL